MHEGMKDAMHDTAPVHHVEGTGIIVINRAPQRGPGDA